jgi:von Willebrand factor A domain-containing protein 8
MDGLHFAERNVLPTLNNLLENRELVLTDGRMLVSPARYQYLLDQANMSIIQRMRVYYYSDNDWFPCTTIFGS